MSDTNFDILQLLPKSADFCVIVGVWNEGTNFTRQIEKMQAFRGVADIIIADGGSSDGASSKEALNDKATALLIKRIPGGLSTQYRYAIRYALKQGYKGIITVDGNGKDGVEAIPAFVEALKGGADLVQGSRFLKGGSYRNTPALRYYGIRFIFNPLMWMACGYFYSDGMNGFKAFSAQLLNDPRVDYFRPVFRRYNLQYYLCYRAPCLDLKVLEIPTRRDYPDDGPVPTKIHGPAGYLSILKELLLTLSGWYNPR